MLAKSFQANLLAPSCQIGNAVYLKIEAGGNKRLILAPTLKAVIRYRISQLRDSFEADKKAGPSYIVPWYSGTAPEGTIFSVNLRSSREIALLAAYYSTL